MEIQHDLDDEPSSNVIRRKRAPAEEAEIDMTPMIDVTFLLLIFFMLTNSLANPAAIPVAEAVHGRGISPEGKQLILIDEQGQYYLGDRPTPENLSPSVDALASEVERNAGGQTVDVIVSAHKSSRHYLVREIIDRLSSIPTVGNVTLGVEEKRE